MEYFKIEPAVPGEVGEKTLVDTSVHPPIVHKLHFLLDEVPEDALFTTFPVYIVSEEAKQAFLKAGFSGVRFDELEIEMSPSFIDAYGEAEPGEYAWMKVEGKAHQDDFGIDQKSFILIVSQRALDLLEDLGIPSAEVDEADA